jgi:hypothetical protein
MAANILHLDPHLIQYQSPGPNAKCTSDSGSFGGGPSGVSRGDGVGGLSSEDGVERLSSGMGSGFFSSEDRIGTFSSSLAMADLDRVWERFSDTE